MKIDSHQHFWHYNTSEFGWIGDNMSVLKRDFLPSDLEVALKNIGLDGSIAVQARQSLDETKWLLQLASENPFIKGVVGWVDLCSLEIESQLVEFSKNKKLVGVRHVIHDEPDDNFMARADFQYGIGLLSIFGLTYDLLLFPKHLKLATELVTRFPNQKFVLDHISKPLIKDQIIEPWKKDIIELSKRPNVYCKLSGMVTEANWSNWKPEDFKKYLDVVYTCFGEDRLMIGSDWPVCTVAGDYKNVMSIVTKFTKKLKPQAQAKILGENCQKFYLEKP
jgi:L-fuconolactonase